MEMRHTIDFMTSPTEIACAKWHDKFAAGGCALACLTLGMEEVDGFWYEAVW